MRHLQLRQLIKEEVSKVLNENKFNPPHTPASLGTNSPERALEFFKSQLEAARKEMRSHMSHPSMKALLSLPGDLRRKQTPQYIKDLSRDINYYQDAVEYTENFIKNKK
jgi:hypothetical protein